MLIPVLKFVKVVMMLWLLKRICVQLHPVQNYVLDGNIILIAFAETSAPRAVW
jgi:hypothetical protein